MCVVGGEGEIIDNLNISQLFKKIVPLSVLGAGSPKRKSVPSTCCIDGPWELH